MEEGALHEPVAVEILHLVFLVDDEHQESVQHEEAGFGGDTEAGNRGLGVGGRGLRAGIASAGGQG